MMCRLSMRSLAGSARTEVAVGTSRLASMLTTTRADGPRRTRGAGSTASAPVGPVGIEDRPTCGATWSIAEAGASIS